MRLGTKTHPLCLKTYSQERAAELLAICSEYDWSAIVRVDPEDEEDLDDLEYKLNPPTIEYEEKKVGRNQPCPCGSGQKFKRCCDPS